MRPTIINSKIIKAFEKVANDDINAIILTDEEMVLEVNGLLKEEDRFSYKAFQEWKQFAVGKGGKTSEENQKKYDELAGLIKKALVIQKRHLFDKFREEPNQWQRWAWIIERKFDDWNIKRKSDVTSDNKPIPIINVLQDNSNEKNHSTE